MRQNILVAGCGSIGLKFALSMAKDHQVFGLKRHTNELPDTITGISADVTQPLTLNGALPSTLDYVVYCLSPGAFNDDAYKAIYVEGLHNLIAEIERVKLKPKRLLFVSSTSVYHQDNDQWVDEQSDTHPSRFSGQRLLEAEQVATHSSIPSTSVRFSGIYGGTRTRLLEQVQNGAANNTSTHYTNRIHEDDCIAILEHLIKCDYRQQPVEACYVASDSEPVRMNELVEWISNEIKLDISAAPPLQKNSTKNKRGAGSKQCDNSRLKETGYQFKYPSFREGYREMIQKAGL